jgi:pimeloyl-ACP methyl ester carboxylesterase
MQIAIRHPDLVRKLIVASSFYKRDGLYPQFWEFMNDASLDNMPQGLKDAYKKVAPDPDDLIKMHDKDAKEWWNSRIGKKKIFSRSVAPTLIIISDADVVKPNMPLK